MLPAKHRLTESTLFAAAVRSGWRAGGPTSVVHLMERESDESALVGFVVSKAVGNAVQRNRVKRRLRAVLAEHTGELKAGSLVVVRALPASADADFQRLSDDVEKNLARVMKRVAA